MALTEEFRERVRTVARNGSYDELTEGLGQAMRNKRLNIDDPETCARMEEIVDIFLDELLARDDEIFVHGDLLA